MKNRKKLKMFQFQNDTPNIQQIVCVNPKEYCIKFKEEEKINNLKLTDVQKHKVY